MTNNAHNDKYALEVLMGNNLNIPTTLLFDLDDTILSAYSRPELAWIAVATEMAHILLPFDPDEIAMAVASFGKSYWSDSTRGGVRRMQLALARREIVAGAFTNLADSNRRPLPMAVAEQLADRFTAYRDEQMYLFPDTHRVIDKLKERGFRIGLVTNGAADTQRAKIDRFDLTRRFDHIQIEEEVGFGKPDERAYLHAMATLGATPSETWMIGDNLEWEVEAPQRLGIYSVWYNATDDELPSAKQVRPDLIIRCLSDLLAYLPRKR